MATACPRGIMAAAFIAVVWPSAVPSRCRHRPRVSSPRPRRASDSHAPPRHASPASSPTTAAARSPGAMVSALGVDDGDDRHRRARHFTHRCAAVGRVRPPRAPRRVCRLAPTSRSASARLAVGSRAAVAAARCSRRHERRRAGRRRARSWRRDSSCPGSALG